MTEFRGGSEATISVRARIRRWARTTRLFLRTCWSQGGGWERFFILIYPIWAMYWIALQIVFALTLDWRASLSLYFVLGVGFLVLHPIWRIPLLSRDTLLRALVASGAIRDDAEQKDALTLADYLTRYGQKGRWMHWYLLSLICFVLFLAASLYQLVFSIFLSETHGMVLLIVYLSLFSGFIAYYGRRRRRFFQEMEARGYPLEAKARRVGA